MNNKKTTISLFLVISISQLLIGNSMLDFNQLEKTECNAIDPEASTVIVGNYTVPGVSGSIPSNQILKIGILDDMEHFTGDHAWKGAKLAATEINKAGGVTINSVDYYVGLAAEDTNEANATLDTSKGIAAANRMITYNNPHSIIGGFRTEAVLAYREVVMDAKIPFLITGASADIFCEDVFNNYYRYNYTFRVMPINGTSLTGELTTYINVLINVLNATYGGGFTKVAILREDLAWNVPLANWLTSYIDNYIPGVTVDQHIAFPIGVSAATFDTYWEMIDSTGIQLTIPLVTSSDAITMATTYKAHRPKCLLAGINLFSQLEEYWDYTEGGAEYEILMQSIHNTSKASETKLFWNNYYAKFNTEPFYTAVGSYDAVRLLANATFTGQSLGPHDIVSELEGFNKGNPFFGIGSKIAFTNSHDLYERYPYAFSLFTQWQTHANKIVVPTYNIIYPDSLATGSVAVPYWGINNLVPGQHAPPEDLYIYDTAEDPDKDGNFDLTWTNATGATSYSVYVFDRDIKYISKRYKVRSYEDVESPITVSGLKTGDYYCIVAAANGTGETLSNTSYVRVELPKPGDFNLYSDADIPVDTDGTFNLNWTVSEGADNYTLFTYNSYITQINSSITSLSNQTTPSPFLISDLTDGDYYYVVVAYNETGEKLSNSVYIKVRYPPGQFVLSSDAELPDTDGKFNLTWTDSARATSYMIFQYSDYIIDVNDSLTIIGTVQATDLSFEITDLDIGFYYYIVQAYNGYNYTESNCIEINVQYYDESTGYWELAPFILDDKGYGHYNWSEIVSFPWCSGSGTLNDPYIIEFIKIDGNDVASCFTIRESNVFFTIRNSSLFNAGDNDNEDAGIKLVHVSYGTLLYLNCSNNNANGIVLDSCQYIDITSCSVNVNSISGIVLIDSNYTMISYNTNTINYNDDYGIHLIRSHHNNITHNTINYNSLIGIFLANSDFNFIDWNTLVGNGQAILDDGQNNIIGDNNDFGVGGGGGFPFEMLYIVLIVGIAIVGVVVTYMIAKRRISISEKKERVISEKKKEKIRLKLEEKLKHVDHLINERQIKLAYKNIGKIKDTADQYDLFAIFNQANKRVEICKEIEAGRYAEVKREEVGIPRIAVRAKEEKEPIPVTEIKKEFNVFLSYSSVDADRYQIAKVGKYLEGYPEIKKVYYYTKDSGQNIVEYMEKTLSYCNVFALFCSEHSKKSKAVEGEWQAAYQMTKKALLKIIPIYENEDDIPFLLGPMLNVKFDRMNLESFVERLYQEILR